MAFNYEDMQIPRKPGVYMMLDSLGNTIYVGKAKNLRNRVSQYFANHKDRNPKVVEMIRHIHSLKYIVTDTELDALLEECRLIKQLKPWYNRQMKNDKKYSYLKITAEPYPRVTIVNEKVADGALFFGPFTSIKQVETAVQYFKDFYPIRKCPVAGLVERTNGCLFLQLGSCLGVCTGRVSSAEYLVYIEEIRQILNGNDRAAVQELTKRMNSAIENLEFEKAAKYRSYLAGLRHVIGKQHLIQSSGKNRNVAAVEVIDTELVKLFLIKGNKVIYRKAFNIVTADSSELKQELVQIIRDKFGIENRGKAGLARHDIDEAQIIHSYLKKNRDRIHSYRIPAAYLKRDTSGLEATVLKIINQKRSDRI